MRVHLLTATGVLVIWVVTHPSTIWAQHCLNLVIKRIPECPMCQNAVLNKMLLSRTHVFVILFPRNSLKIRWHYTSSPFISSPVISSRSFCPLIHFVPGHFVPGHFVPWSFCPLVISSPWSFCPILSLSWIYRGSCLVTETFSKM
jgi:hypothetical protein